MLEHHKHHEHQLKLAMNHINNELIMHKHDENHEQELKLNKNCLCSEGIEA